VKPAGSVIAGIQVCEAINVFVGKVSVVHSARPAIVGGGTWTLG
jgi:hypothetical protein